jgi:hypothetical protein
LFLVLVIGMLSGALSLQVTFAASHDACHISPALRTGLGNVFPALDFLAFQLAAPAHAHFIAAGQ